MVAMIPKPPVQDANPNPPPQHSPSTVLPSPRSSVQQPTAQVTKLPGQTNIPTAQISILSTTTPAPKPTSTSTLTEDPCTVCIKCEDERTEEELDPLSEGTRYPELDLPIEIDDTFDLSHNQTDLTSLLLPDESNREQVPELQKRVNNRAFSVCGVPTLAPQYTSWSRRNFDTRMEMYGYYLIGRCPNYNWELRPDVQAPRTGSTATYVSEFYLRAREN